MEKLEKVETLREKTGVTYEEAKRALEACDYDILDAVVYLEALGRINAPVNKSYTTDYKAAAKESDSFAKARETYEKDCKKGSVGNAMNSFFEGVGDILKKSWDSKFVVMHKEERKAEVPVLILVVLLIGMFWVTLPLLLIGMFFDFRYKFEGVGTVSINLNEMCDKASETCENLKKDHEKNE